METEFEATFWPIEKEDIRNRLEKAGAVRIYPERSMRRVVFHLHPDAPLKKAWARIRDEGDKVTMSIKQSGSALEEQKEVQITIDDFDKGVEILRGVGCSERAFQETKRELWKLDDAEITIDEWPFLDPFVEIEGKSEGMIREVAKRLSFDWSEALFCSIDELYIRRYGITKEDINLKTPRLVFGGPNPFDTGK